MKRNLSILLVALMIFSLCTTNIKADDRQSYIDTWILSRDSLKSVYEDDKKEYDELNKIYQSNKKDLENYKNILKTSEDRLNELTQIYNARQDALEAVENKEDFIIQKENELDSTIILKREELAGLKTLASNSLKALEEANDNLELMKTLGDEDFIAIAQAEYESKAEEHLLYQAGYDIKREEFYAYEEKLAENNEELAQALLDLGFLQIDLADKEDAYFKIESEYNSLLQEVESAKVLVETLEKEEVEPAKEAKDKKELELNEAKKAYEEASNMVTSLTSLNDTINQCTITDLSSYTVSSKSLYSLALSGAEEVFGDYDLSAEDVKGFEVALRRAYKDLTVIVFADKEIAKEYNDLKIVASNTIGIGKDYEETTKDKIIVLKVKEPEKTSDVSKNEVKKLEEELESSPELKTVSIMDISLAIQGTNDTISQTNESVSITITIPEDYINSNPNIIREYQVIRTHTDEVASASEEDENQTSVSISILQTQYDESNKTITFETDRFSTYALVYKDVKKETGKTDGSDSGKRTEANTPCEEWNHSKNWTWSESQGKCVYRVTNTSSK